MQPVSQERETRGVMGTESADLDVGVDVAIVRGVEDDKLPALVLDESWRVLQSLHGHTGCLANDMTAASNG